MKKFYNPFDISKDGNDAIVDGIRYHIRESEQIKTEIINHLQYIKITGSVSALDILEYILDQLGYSLDNLTIADEHELLDEIKVKFVER